MRFVYYKKIAESKKVVVKEIKAEKPLRVFKKLYSEELNDFLIELKQRIDLYKKKAELLNRDEKEMESFKADLDIQKKELVSMREDLSKALELTSKERIALNNDLIAYTETERKNLKNLSTVYASMDASKAAQILSKLNSKTSAKVLSGIPSKKSAKILAELAPTTAVKLTKQMKKLESPGKISGESLKEKNLKKLATIYQNMEASKAVSIIEELDDQTTVSILSYMNEKKLAKILELVGAEKASDLTEKIRNKKMQIGKYKIKGV